MGENDTGKSEGAAGRAGRWWPWMVAGAAVGGGAVAGLGAVARRKRGRDRAACEPVDAELRGIEVFMAAVEKLGHEEALVRSSAVHALDQLGRKYPELRGVVVETWCAYLRRPFTPEPDAAEEQEYAVRATVQRLLAGHLKGPRPEGERDAQPPEVTPAGYWRVDRIDLAGATLIDIDFTDCRLPEADFTGAHFHGSSSFTDTRFGGDAQFRDTRFHGDAQFGRARFDGDAVFDRARFHGEALFGAWLDGEDWYGARFGGQAGFSEAQFHDEAEFQYARFDGDARFDRARFNESAWFDDARFSGDARFDDARFGGDAGFGKTRFDGRALFSHARFGWSAWFGHTRFGDATSFSHAHFDMAARFDHVGSGDGMDLDMGGVSALLEPEGGHVWPLGYRLVPCPEGEREPGLGRLERLGGAA